VNSGSLSETTAARRRGDTGLTNRDRLSWLSQLAKWLRVPEIVLRPLRLVRSRVEGPRRRKLREARGFVSSNKATGRRQLEFLKCEGCQPASRVLEVGCGALNASLFTIKYLDPGHWAGIDPNDWLREATMAIPRYRRLAEGRQAAFLSVDDFDASSLGMEFDFVLAHSILSHAAHWQLPQFLHNVSNVLAPSGRILASIRLAEGNIYGSYGSPGGVDSDDESWVYPGVSYFSLATVVSAAEAEGLSVTVRPEYTAILARRFGHCHDWLVFRRDRAADSA
jgi:SAM-dependent methyltransferase